MQLELNKIYVANDKTWKCIDLDYGFETTDNHSVKMSITNKYFNENFKELGDTFNFKIGQLFEKVNTIDDYLVVTHVNKTHVRMLKNKVTLEYLKETLEYDLYNDNINLVGIKGYKYELENSRDNA